MKFPQLQFFNQIPKRKKIIILSGIIAFFILGIGGFAVFAFTNQTTKSVCPENNCTTPLPTPLSTFIPSPSPSPTPALSPALLNGELVPNGQENIHPLAVMIENHPKARPQSGLGQADLVYEAIAEGGITRFMAVYKDPQQSVRVGPIRSARTYYVDFATELGAFYAHVGGSAPALEQIKKTGVLDLNQFSVGSAAYQRDFSRNVALEHTMYSSTNKLWEYATGKMGWSKTGNFKPWLFTDELAPENRPASQKISVSVSDRLYDVAWNYVPVTNSYLRSMAGSPHIDANTNQQISAKTIILQTVNKTGATKYGGQKNIWDYRLTGNGTATIIQNGSIISATWKKDGTERTRYFDETGKEISLVRGKIWVHIIHPDSSITL